MIEVRDLRTGAVAASAHPPFSNGSGRPDWSPNGRTLTVPDGDKGTIEEYDFDPQRPALRSSRTIRGQLQAGSGIAYNPAGDRFVRRGWDGVVYLFDTATGRPLFS